MASERRGSPTPVIGTEAYFTEGWRRPGSRRPGHGSLHTQTAHPDFILERRSRGGRRPDLPRPRPVRQPAPDDPHTAQLTVEIPSRGDGGGRPDRTHQPHAVAEA